MINNEKYSYIDELPIEILEHIFLQLGPIEKIWPYLSLVSKRFHLAASSSVLWSSFAIHNAQFNANVMEMVSKYSKNVFLKHLDIVGCNGNFNVHKVVSNFPNLERLSIRFLELDDDPADPALTPFVNHNLKFINITNLHSNDFLDAIECPSLEYFVCSGFNYKDASKLTNWITKKKYLKHLDISRTCLREDNIKSILNECRDLEVFAATEIMKRNEESRYSQQYPNIKFLFDLLSHQINPINSKKEFVHCLYNIDGHGCSLLADAIYVGTELNVLKYIIREFEIDINRFNIVPDPWTLPYPMKHLTHKNRMPLALHQAVKLGLYDIAEYLLKIGADVNLCCDPCNRPILSHVLLSESDQEVSSNMFSLLLFYGARVDIEDSEGLTPVDIVVQKKMVITMWLMANKKDLTQNEKDLILMASVELADEPLFWSILVKGANPYATNKLGENITTLAIKNNNVTSLQMICKRVDDIRRLLNERDLRGWTPYHHLLAETQTCKIKPMVDVLLRYLNQHMLRWQETIMGDSFEQFCERNAVDEERKRIFQNHLN